MKEQNVEVCEEESQKQNGVKHIPSMAMKGKEAPNGIDECAPAASSLEKCETVKIEPVSEELENCVKAVERVEGKEAGGGGEEDGSISEMCTRKDEKPIKIRKQNLENAHLESNELKPAENKLLQGAVPRVLLSKIPDCYDFDE